MFARRLFACRSVATVVLATALTLGGGVTMTSASSTQVDLHDSGSTADAPDDADSPTTDSSAAGIGSDLPDQNPGMRDLERTSHDLRQGTDPVEPAPSAPSDPPTAEPQVTPRISPRAATWTVYSVTDKKTTSGYTDYSQRLGNCKAIRSGTTCTISVSKAATRTVGLALGASRSTITAGLNISSASTVSMSVPCSSPRLRAGQTYRAWPMGNRYSYRVWKTYSNTAGVVTVTKSTTQYAFSPAQNSITCG